MQGMNGRVLSEEILHIHCKICNSRWVGSTIAAHACRYTQPRHEVRSSREDRNSIISMMVKLVWVVCFGGDSKDCLDTMVHTTVPFRMTK